MIQLIQKELIDSKRINWFKKIQLTQIDSIDSNRYNWIFEIWESSRSLKKFPKTSKLTVMHLKSFKSRLNT